MLVASVEVEIDRVLAARLKHVERSRRRMIGDAQRDIDTIRGQYMAKVQELAAIREELIAARELLQWTASYPEQVEAYGFPSALACGLLAPVRRTLQISARVEFPSVVAALEADAAVLSDELGPRAKAALGVEVEATPETEALWHADERHQKWAKEQLERARGLA